jgi:hypothetical protein
MNAKHGRGEGTNLMYEYNIPTNTKHVKQFLQNRDNMLGQKK